MKTNRTPLTLAVLAATTDTAVGIAALNFAFDEDTGWVQLLPTGHFNAIDGRPSDVPGNKWFIDADIATRLISTTKNAANDLVIDYEHQTLNKEQNGQPAPAAGWFKEMEWREGSGLWIKPEWTSRALEYIKNKEYRYLSAVFPYNKQTGVPLYIHSAALTNRAGIDGMEELEALSAKVLSDHNQESSDMNEAMRKLFAKLGLELAKSQIPNDEQATAALSALDQLIAKANTADELETKVVALSAQDNYDPAKHVPLEAFQELEKTVAKLSAQSQEGEIDAVILKAREDGRLLASMESWARDLGTKDMAALNTYLDKAQPVAALSGMQTDTTQTPEDETGVAVLSAEEKEAAKLLGKSEADFAKLKAAQA